MRTFKVLIIVILAVCFTLNAQQTPAKKQMKTIAISGATAHIGNGSLIKNSLVVFDNGTIRYVGEMDASKLN